MDVQELLARATDTVTVRRVFGEPIERDGVLVIPVARVRGGAGGGSGTGPAKGTAGAGSGTEPAGDASGSGAGMGFVADPAGVYVVRGGDVTWRPAVDVNRIVLGGQLVGVVLFLTLRSILRRR
jgi:uncharacterized spore protein YtfJ